MNKELEKVCEELAEKHASERRGYDFKIGDKYAAEQMVLDFKAGFEAAIESEQVKALVRAVKKYESMVQYIYDTCLCERFETYGFDYNEKHPKRKEQIKGTRVNTPCDYIEKEIGFEWRYSEPEGCCDSWKELKLKALEAWEGQR